MSWAVVLTVSVVVTGGVLLWRRLMRALDARAGADWGARWLNRLDGLNRVVCRRFHRLQHAPLDLPPAGGAVVAANHVSGLDPLLMIAASPRPLRFIIAREQYERWWLKWLFRRVGCIPIGRQGGHRAALSAAKAALADGEVVALFPQGGIQADDRWVALKPGVALLAREAGVPVCPVRIEGVRGRGRVLGALFLRSRARIASYARMHAGETEAFLAELGRLLAGETDNSPTAA